MRPKIIFFGIVGAVVIGAWYLLAQYSARSAAGAMPKFVEWKRTP